MTNLSATATGDGATHAFTGFSLPAGANAVQLSAPSANSSPVRLGGSEVTPGVGFEMAPGSAFLIPSVQSYAQMEYNVASGDKLELLFVTLPSAGGRL